MEFLEKLQELFGHEKSGKISTWNGLNDSALSSETLRWIEDMKNTEPYRLTQIVLSTCGILGNVLSVVGWSSNKTWSSAALFLVTLAVYQIVFLVGCSLEILLRMMNVQKMASVQTYKGFYISASCIADFGLQGSSLMTVAIATERLLAATKPQQVALICCIVKAKVVVVVTVFVCVFRFAIRLLYEIPVVIGSNRQSMPIIGNTTVDDNMTSSQLTTYVIKYEEWTYIRLVLDIALVYTIPWILLFVFNIVTIVALKKGQWVESIKQIFKFKSKKKLCSQIRFQKRLFYVVFVVSIFSMVTYPVAVVTRLVTSDVRRVFRPLVNILFLVKIVHSGINFVIYYCINSKFRRKIINTLFCMRDDFNDWRRNCIYL